MVKIGLPCEYPFLCNAMSAVLAITVLTLVIWFVVYIVKQIRKNRK